MEFRPVRGPIALLEHRSGRNRQIGTDLDRCRGLIIYGLMCSPGGGAKKTGWGAVRKAAGGGAFVQGRAGQDSGKRAGAKKKKEVSEDMGSFTVNRSKK